VHPRSSGFLAEGPAVSDVPDQIDQNQGGSARAASAKSFGAQLTCVSSLEMGNLRLVLAARHGRSGGVE